jgi:hypothetical protein
MQRLVIELNDSGQVNVSGPIQNKLLCLGMLEFAKDVILKFNIEDQPRVALAPAVDINSLRKQ